jgi:hypothetical protein
MNIKDIKRLGFGNSIVIGGESVSNTHWLVRLSAITGGQLLMLPEEARAQVVEVLVGANVRVKELTYDPWEKLTPTGKLLEFKKTGVVWMNDSFKPERAIYKADSGEMAAINYQYAKWIGAESLYGKSGVTALINAAKKDDATVMIMPMASPGGKDAELISLALKKKP